jgi:hypothetical protein
MKIRYISPSPKAGQEEHIRNDVGNTLVAAGFAVELKYRSYVERLADLPPAAPDPSAPPYYPPPGVWQVSELPFSGRPVLWFRICSEQRPYECETLAAKDGCPPHLIRQFLEKKHASNPAAIEAAQERLLQDRMRQESQQKDAESKGFFAVTRGGQ